MPARRVPVLIGGAHLELQSAHKVLERGRAEPVLAMRLVTDGLQRLFDSRQIAALGPLAPPLLLARDLGWRFVASSPFLRRHLASHAGRL